jgi:hypothetical protein
MPFSHSSSNFEHIMDAEPYKQGFSERRTMANLLSEATS